MKQIIIIFVFFGIILKMTTYRLFYVDRLKYDWIIAHLHDTHIQFLYHKKNNFEKSFQTRYLILRPIWCFYFQRKSFGKIEPMRLKRTFQRIFFVAKILPCLRIDLTIFVFIDQICSQSFICSCLSGIHSDVYKDMCSQIYCNLLSQLKYHCNIYVSTQLLCIWYFHSNRYFKERLIWKLVIYHDVFLSQVM